MNRFKRLLWALTLAAGAAAGQGIVVDGALIKALQSRAPGEDLEAQYLLGKRLLESASEKSTDANTTATIAKTLLEKAAARGHIQAQYALGMAHGGGFFTDIRDYSQAGRWLEQASAGGVVDAHYQLAQLRRLGLWERDGSEAETLRLYRKAAEHDHPKALRVLGWMYGNGEGGAPKDAARAARYLERAADLGDLESKYLFAIALQRGDGVKRNPAEAAAWMTKAAQAGHYGAYQAVGDMYFKGEGMPRDLVESYAYYGMSAARTGNRRHRQRQEEIGELLSPVELERASRLLHDRLITWPAKE